MITPNKTKQNKPPAFPKISESLVPLLEGFEQLNRDSFWQARRMENKSNIFTLADDGSLTKIHFKSTSNINFELLCQNTSLEELVIENVDLSVFPTEILKLSNLASIEMRQCNLTSFPEEIKKLKKLKSIDFSFNNLETVPDSLSDLKSLRQLILHCNNLQTIPKIIFNLSNLFALSLVSNKIKTIPSNIKNLQSLQYFFISDNAIKALPESFGKLENLEYLSINENKLSQLPKTFINLKKLLHIDLSENLFTDFPIGLCMLDEIDFINIQNNNIQTIPEELKNTTRLRNFFIHGNPINFPDPSFHSLNAQEMIQTLLAMQSSTLKALKQAKILVVGDERVGKTSIINRLVGNPHDENQKSTQGIDISELEFSNFKTNIWDFAGQELTHQTHQFFLTERSLYVYVLDAQKEDNQARDLHWLNTIKSYSDNSPIIIVVNHSDKNLNYRFDKVRYQDNFQIADVIYTSACNLNKLCEQSKNILGDSISKLTRAIEIQLPKLPGIERELPESWHTVKTAMESYKKDLNVIEKDTYDLECQKAGVVGKPLQTALLKILNSIGTIVAFPNDFRLQLTQILKPEWVTNAVYKIVRSQSENPGIYSEELISEILNSDYTHTHQQWLIDLLIKFELGFRIPESNELLIPMRLPSVTPDFNKSKYQQGLNIRFNYHNQGLLKLNVLPQLIVRLNHYTDNETSKYWRHGIFIHLKNCQGVIIADESKQIIEVFLSQKNENARTLLQWIRSNLEKIEESQTKANKSKLPYIEEIALFDDNDKTIIGHAKYAKIERAYKREKETIDLEVKNPETNELEDKEYNVAELLGLYKQSASKFNVEKFPNILMKSLLSLTDIRARINNEKEDNINDLLAISLKGGGFGVADQSRGGYSESGKGSGERDLVILNEYGQQACLIEAMCLTSVTKKTIKSHYNKLINHYNTYGNPVDFLVTYAKVKNFEGFWTKYMREFDGFTDSTSAVTDKFNFKAGYTLIPIEDSDESRKIYHMVVNFGVKP